MSAAEHLAATDTATGLGALPSHMHALTFQGKCSVAYERVPAPRLQQPGDVIVRVELAGLCGSDLHPYHCREVGLDVGTVMGHEFVGTVAAAGAGVSRFAPGDRVLSAFTTCCGACFYCQRGLTCRCERSQLFGWVAGGAGLHGAQAQYVRVPDADGTLLAIPPGLPDELALLLGDVLSTGAFAAHSALRLVAALQGETPEAEQGNTDTASSGGGAAADDGGGQPAAAAAAGQPPPQGGLVLAVVGCGPVGLMAVLGALELGGGAVRTVYAVDSLPDRLALAREFGAVPLDASACDPAAAVREATAGRGADAVLEAVGAPGALRAALGLARPGAVLSSVGCHTDPGFPFTPAEAYDKNLTLCTGRCPARHYMGLLLPRLLAGGGDGRLARAGRIISHRLPLSAGPGAYDMFSSKRDGCTKVVFDPWAGDVACAS